MQLINIKKRILLLARNRIQFVFVILFCVSFLGTICSLALPRTTTTLEEMNAEATTPVGEIYDGVPLTFEFSSAKQGLKGMSFTAATYSRVPAVGVLVLSVSDSDGTVILNWRVPASYIRDNEPITITFPSSQNSQNKTYSVLFQTEGIDKSNAISFWANNNSKENISTRLNDIVVPNVLLYSLLYDSNVYPFTWDLFVCCAVFFVLSLVSYQTNKSTADKEQGETNAK